MSLIPIRILLVEDDELFRLGLRIRLQQEDGFEVLAEAEDGEMAVDLSSRLPLDIVLLDIGLPGMGGIEACRQIHQHRPELPILVLTSHSQYSVIAQLIEVGVQGYCLKGIEADLLILAIRSVVAGASWWDQTATTEIQAIFEGDRPITNELEIEVESTNPLTQREQEVLALVAAHKTNQEIATTLYITPGTVKVHIHTILHKLEAHDRREAVAIALERDLISHNLLSSKQNPNP
ncbi:response regulator [Leptolyngbya sp. AN02str]|uniref:response regulator n=1 Tax=Leptolyngbya sp. AN02str TaxID=3423363 RepID=UPI003D31D0A8